MRIEMRRDWIDPRDQTSWRVTLSRGYDRASVPESRRVSWIRFIRASEVYSTISEDVLLDLDALECGELSRFLDRALLGT